MSPPWANPPCPTSGTPSPQKAFLPGCWQAVGARGSPPPLSLQNSPNNISGISNPPGTPRDDGELGGNFLHSFQNDNVSVPATTLISPQGQHLIPQGLGAIY